MKKLNEILFSLISPVILGEGVSSETAAVDEQTFRAVYALAKKHDLANLLAGAVRCANAQMQNAKCKMQNERTVGDAGPYGDTRCANAQMQNAECGMRNERTVGDAGPYGDTGCANAQMQNAECGMQNGECGISAELMAELEKAELTAAWRVRNIENEQGRVRKCLEEAEIPFILLKGAVVRDFYPEAWMRTSSDIDVLVPRDELSHAICAIEDGLGYRISTVEPHDASLFAKSGVHLDMHTLFEGDREDCKLLDEAWSMCANAQMQNAECRMQNERTVGDAGPYGDTGCANTLTRKCKMQNAECKTDVPVEQMQNAECKTDVPVEQMQNAKCKMQNVGYERFLTPEHFYFYHVAHMAAHMRNGGCGIRPFIDLYLIRRNMPCERAVLDGMLSEYGLARFDEASVALAERWMCANAQMQNAECEMQNERTVGDAGPYGDTGCANTLSRKCKMQNAECKTDVPVEQMQNAKCKMQNDGTNRRAGACSRRDSHLWGSEAKPRESVGAIHESPDSIASPTVINAKECCTLAPSTAGGPPPSRSEAQDESPDNDADAKHNARSVEITTEQLSAFEEYVLTGGVYGSGEQYVAAKQRGGKQGKAKYVLGRIFMPYEQLKLRHPRLDGHRWLTPVFEVYRWCSLVVPSRLRRSKKELSSAMRVDENMVTSVEELLNGLEL